MLSFSKHLGGGLSVRSSNPVVAMTLGFAMVSWWLVKLAVIACILALYWACWMPCYWLARAAVIGTRALVRSTRRRQPVTG